MTRIFTSRAKPTVEASMLPEDWKSFRTSR